MTHPDLADVVREVSDLADWIDDVTVLHEKASEGTCPFCGCCRLMVLPTKQVFVCFDCYAGGDVFKLVMRTHGVGFDQAVRVVGARYGVVVP